MTNTRARAALAWVLWLGALAVLIVIFVSVRAEIERVHVALAFLLIVLGGSATGGRALGLSLTALAYLDFHFYFVEHYDSLSMENPLDALVLVAFLVTGVVAEQLVTRARSEALAARSRAAEVERLANLGAESLSAGRAEEALERVLELVRASANAAQVTVLPPGTEFVGWPSTPTEHSLPLTVHGQSVGVLVLRFDAPVALTAEQRRFLDALSYYAALAIERVRLSAAAERAEALRQASVLRESLIAGFSHDLRTPLTTIKALANRLDVRFAPEAAAIEREADRLHRFATDLLDLSRLQAGAMPLRRELNTAADLVGAALQRLDLAHADGRVRVTPFDETDGETLAGHFDFVQSLRALWNLLENALKYALAPSIVELEVRRIGEALRFRVSDRGPGIPVGDAERIFEPFYRGLTASPDAGGAGLGLAIARRLAREQGGDVLLYRRPDGGSHFDLLLPGIVPRDAAAAHADFSASAIAASEPFASP